MTMYVSNEFIRAPGHVIYMNREFMTGHSDLRIMDDFGNLVVTNDISLLHHWGAF